MVKEPPETERYTVTYAFEDCDEHADAVGRIRETVAELQHETLDIAFLGATQVIDSAGHVRTVTARYEASTQGIVGLLNCRATLPACGSPQHTEGGRSAPDGPDVAVATGTSS